MSPFARSERRAVAQRNVTAEPLPERPLGIRWLGAHPARKPSLAIIHRAGPNHIHHRLWTPTPDPAPQGDGSRGTAH
jgi:hypothetical protein